MCCYQSLFHFVYKQWKSPIRLLSAGLASSFLSGDKLAYDVEKRYILEIPARPQTSVVYGGHEVIPAWPLWWEVVASEVLRRVVGAGAQGLALGLWASSSSLWRQLSMEWFVCWQLWAELNLILGQRVPSQESPSNRLLRALKQDTHCVGPKGRECVRQWKEPGPELADTELCPALTQPAVGLPQPWEPRLSALKERVVLHQGFQGCCYFKQQNSFHKLDLNKERLH